MYRSAGKEKESRCLVFTFSTKREIRHFHVVVVKWRQRNVPRKRDALAKLLFGQFKPIAFLSFALTSPSSLLPIHLCLLFAADSKKNKSLYFQKKCVLHAISVQIWIRNGVHWRHKIAKESSCNVLLIDSHWFLWKSKCHDWYQCWK